MADDSNFRSYRPADPRWPAPAAPEAASKGGSDPLAELARLIGQTDPFAEPQRGAAPTPVRPAPVAAPPQAPARRPVPSPSTASDPYGSPLHFSPREFPRRGETAAEPQQQNSFQPAYDPAIYGTREQHAGAASQAYYEDPSHVAQGDEACEEEYADARPQRGLMRVAVVLGGLAIIGTGGFLGYRALFSGGASGPPPVIKANTAPSKIVPTPSAEASNKQIFDRVADASQGERVVSREEKPVEVKDTSRPAARVVFPGLPESSSSPDTAMAAASPPLNTDPGGPASAEPKKIRTVTIRPDGTASAPPQRPATRTAAASPAAPAAAANAPAAAPLQGHAPLSLSPQVASAEASARSAPPPARTPAPAAATRVATAAAGSGSYSVQISSQRSEAEAQASFRTIQAKFSSLLGDRQPIIRRADLGDKGIYFRTMVGPFGSADEAGQFCGSLKSAGGQCVVQRN